MSIINFINHALRRKPPRTCTLKAECPQDKHFEREPSLRELFESDLSPKEQPKTEHHNGDEPMDEHPQGVLIAPLTIGDQHNAE